MADEMQVKVSIRWNGQLYDLYVAKDGTFGDLKRLVCEATGVKESRQKLLGLGNRLCDGTPVAELNVKKTVMMIGTREEVIEKVLIAEQEAPTNVIDDFDLDYNDAAERDPSKRYTLLDVPSVEQKFKRRMEDVTINFAHSIRPGKCLLVLDVDYTIYDHRSTAENIEALTRPGLHAFLATVYEHFDICVWSQTNWRWLEAKITQLGMLGRDDYKVSFILDRSSMFSVTSVDRKAGKERKHEVKPLRLIWEKIPQFSAKNTVHVDDLSRNFALNPQNGIKITPFKNGPAWRHHDMELHDVTQYLVHLASRYKDFSEVDHRNWKSTVSKFRS